MNPYISVVIPVYNVEDYLQDCIDSLMNQTLQNIEYIFVNDASTDHSLQILESNAAMYPSRMTIINSPQNRCQGGARNLGIKAARGDYIGFVDSDDLVLSDMYENLYRPIIESRHTLDAVFCQYMAVPEKYNISEYSLGGTPFIKWNTKLIDLNHKELSIADRKDMMAYPIGGVYCGIYRKETIIKNQLFFPEHLRYEDNYWSTFLKIHLTRVYFKEKIGYLYRQRGTSTVHSFNQNYQYDRLTIENMQIKTAKEMGIFEQYKDALEYIYTFRYGFNTFIMFMNLFNPIPEKLLVDIMHNLKSMFPHWKDNPYYCELTGRKIKLRDQIIYRFPSLVIKYYPIYKRIKG